MAALKDARAMAEALNVTPNEAASATALSCNHDGQRRSAFDLLSYPDARHRRPRADLAASFGALDRKIAEQIEIDAKYAVYLDRQAADVDTYRRDEALTLGDDDRLRDAARTFQRSPPQAYGPQPRDHRPGRPHRRHDAGGADAAGGACPAASVASADRGAA